MNSERCGLTLVAIVIAMAALIASEVFAKRVSRSMDLG